MSVKNKIQNHQPDFSQIIKNNPSGYILRKGFSEKTGGLLHGRTMANLDSLGEGIQGRISFGHKVAYPVESVVEYIKEKVIVNDQISVDTAKPVKKLEPIGSFSE